MATQKKSAQRDAILAELLQRYDHPTAEALYLDLKKKIPNLSLATVYRNLRIFEESGKVLRIPGEDAEHFDGHTHAHYHLTCKECKRIIDIEISNTKIIDTLPNDFGGKIEKHTLMYFGLCPECAKR